jgi:hypothetical protein
MSKGAPRSSAKKSAWRRTRDQSPSQRALERERAEVDRENVVFRRTCARLVRGAAARQQHAARGRLAGEEALQGRAARRRHPTA